MSSLAIRRRLDAWVNLAGRLSQAVTKKLYQRAVGQGRKKNTVCEVWAGPVWMDVDYSGEVTVGGDERG